MNSRLVGITLTVSFALLTSCSSSEFKRPESIDSKMARYKAKNLSRNKVPHLSVADRVVGDSQFQKWASNKSDSTPSSHGRTPASFVTDEESGQDQAKDYSNKKLYFLTLHSQYNELKQYVDSESTPELNSCPSFHTSFVEEEERELIKGTNRKQHYAYNPSSKLTPKKLQDKGLVSLYPELQLSITNDASHPTVAESLQNHDKLKSSPKTFQTELQQKVEKALAVHLEQTYHELKELCDYGSSDNYYTYENLVTHTRKQKTFTPTVENMKTLLKTTLFSNMAVISSLREQREKMGDRGRSIASTQELSQDQYANETQARTQAKWIEGYFQGMIEKR